MALIGPGGERRGIPGADESDDKPTDDSTDSSSSGSTSSNTTKRRRNFQQLRKSSRTASGGNSSPDLSEETESALDRGAFGQSSSSSSSSPSSSSSSSSTAASNANSGGTGNGSDPIDQAVSGAQDLFGVSAYQQSEQFSENKRQFEQAGSLGKFNTATEIGFDLFLDNPNASLQETTSDVIGTVTGAGSDEELAQQFQRADQGITQSIDQAVSGTPLDNPATDAVRTVGDILIADTARTFVEAGTGIDTETGETEAQTGALDAFDIGLTVGTAGAGKAALSGLRSADEAARGVRSVDDLFSLGSRASDEAATTATRGSKSADETDSLPVLFDDAARKANDAARATDDAGRAAATGAGTVAGTRAADESSSFLEDAAEVINRARRGGDDAARSADETVQGADETVQGADEAASETGSTVSRITSRAGRAARRGASSRTAKLAGAGTAAGAGLVAGGTVIESLTGAGSQNRVGNTASGSSTQSGTDASSTNWRPLQSIDELAGGWTLSVQESRNGSQRRYFVLRLVESDDSVEVLTSGGGVESFEASASLNSIPSFDSEDAARAAHQNWLDEQEKNGEQVDRQWTDWEESNQAPPWYVYRRSQQNSERQQFVVTATRDGATIYLAPGGEIVEQPHIYTSAQAVADAIRAYFDAVERGDVPETARPTGGQPSPSAVSSEATQTATQDEATSGESGGILGWLFDHPVISISALVLLVLLYQRSQGELAWPEVSLNGGNTDG